MESVSRLVILVLVVSGAWWLWSGPIRNMRTVTFEEQMELNLDNMKRRPPSKDRLAAAIGPPATRSRTGRTGARTSSVRSTG